MFKIQIRVKFVKFHFINRFMDKLNLMKPHRPSNQHSLSSWVAKQSTLSPDLHLQRIVVASYCLDFFLDKECLLISKRYNMHPASATTQ